VRGEFDALRRIASLVSDYLDLDTSRLRLGVAERAKLDELRDALDDLRLRFPYTLEAPQPVLDVALARSAQTAASRPDVGASRR
jgi:hypothetical protein